MGLIKYYIISRIYKFFCSFSDFILCFLDFIDRYLKLRENEIEKIQESKLDPVLKKVFSSLRELSEKLKLEI